MQRGEMMPRVKHYFEPSHLYHLTTRTREGVFAFESDAAKRVIASAVAFYRERGDWKVYGFVVMANHVHLVVSVGGTNLSQTMGGFKKYVFHQLGGFVEGGLWERRFDDNAIIHLRELQAVIRYDHNNPVRIGLVSRAEDYFWSSARNYASLSPVAMEIDRLE
jgi:putative transposase